MYEYKIIKIKINIWNGKAEHDYEELIKEHSEAGWRLVQVAHKVQVGTLIYQEIILERPKGNYV